MHPIEQPPACGREWFPHRQECCEPAKAEVEEKLADMTNTDLAAKSSHRRTAGPPTWSIRRRIYRGRQCSYSRPDTGKVSTPHLQTHASLQVQRAWWEGTAVW
ncbi:hypothetical protein BHM03_00008395 [Ensete ventricosum]|nr:hypothetical protein BHM03_00008395 [Ensete ventricosum]